MRKINKKGGETVRCIVYHQIKSFSKYYNLVPIRERTTEPQMPINRWSNNITVCTTDLLFTSNRFCGTRIRSAEVFN